MFSAALQPHKQEAESEAELLGLPWYLIHNASIAGSDLAHCARHLVCDIFKVLSVLGISIAYVSFEEEKNVGNKQADVMMEAKLF